MTVTIDARSKSDLEDVLAALESFSVKNFQINTPVRTATASDAFYLVEGNGNEDDFWSGAGIWQDDDRSVGEIRTTAWNRNETYLLSWSTRMY